MDMNHLYYAMNCGNTKLNTDAYKLLISPFSITEKLCKVNWQHFCIVDIQVKIMSQQHMHSLSLL